jgi:SAM-dependent methyltransferase
MTKNGIRESKWRRLARRRFRKKKVSRVNIEKLCQEYATELPTLLIHESIEYRRYFPNSFTVSKRPDKNVDRHVDIFYEDLRAIASESYEVIACIGLLEHVPDPQRLIDDLHRILKPGGKLIFHASGAFSFHEGPNDYFHFTPFSVRLLFRNWRRIEMLRGSSQPFETIGILIQRILIQCDVSPLARPFIELLHTAIPLLDRFITRQYDTAGRRSIEHEIDSMLPSNIQAIVVK